MTHALRLKATAEALGNALEPHEWCCHAAGEGAEGTRLYDWGRVEAVLHGSVWLAA